MAKTFNNLFDKLLDPDFLYRAFILSSRGKRHKPQTIEFANNLPQEIQQLIGELESGEYRPRAYKEFYVYEPKKRLIQAPHFRDVVVQRAIHEIISPIFERSFIFDSYGCRVGKGTHAASEQCHKFVRQSNPDSFYCQMDISKYFFNVNKDVLMRELEKRISDAKMLSLLSLFLPAQKGMPIGNLLSQLFSNVYLNAIDHFIKRVLKVKKYIRYVDDFVMFGLSKSEIHKNLCAIRERLSAMDLSLSRFTIQKCNRGINFVGYRTFSFGKFLRKKTLVNFKKALKSSFSLSIVAILGHAKHSRNFRAMVDSAINTFSNVVSPSARNHLGFKYKAQP